MIAGIFELMFFVAAVRGLIELKKHMQKKYGRREKKLLKPEKQTRIRRYYFWNSIQDTKEKQV